MKIKIDNSYGKYAAGVQMLSASKQFQNQLLAAGNFNRNYYHIKLIFFLACFQVLFGLLMICLGTMSLSYLTNLLNVESNIWCGSLNTFIGIITVLLFSRKCSIFGLINERTAIITSLLLNGLNLSFIHLQFFAAIINWNSSMSQTDTSRPASELVHVILMMMLFFDMILVTYLIYRFIRLFFSDTNDKLPPKQKEIESNNQIGSNRNWAWNGRKPQQVNFVQPVFILPSPTKNLASVTATAQSTKSFNAPSIWSSRKNVGNPRYKICKSKSCNNSSIERKINRTKSRKNVSPEKMLIKTYTGLDKRLANEFLEKCDWSKKRTTL